MADQGTAGPSEAARVITIERLLADPGRGERSRERFERVLVTAHAYGAYRTPPADLHPLPLAGYDLSRLTEVERAQLERLLEKARGAEVQAPPGGGADLGTRVREPKVRPAAGK